MFQSYMKATEEQEMLFTLSVEYKLQVSYENEWA